MKRFSHENAQNRKNKIFPFAAFAYLRGYPLLLFLRASDLWRKIRVRKSLYQSVAVNFWLMGLTGSFLGRIRRRPLGCGGTVKLPIPGLLIFLPRRRFRDSMPGSAT